MILQAFSVIRNHIAFNTAAFVFFEPKTAKIKGAVLDNIDSQYLGSLLQSIQIQRDQSVEIPIKGKSQSKLSSVINFMVSGILW